MTNSGQRLGDRYVLTDRLAVGGMGEVWSAVDEALGRSVAVKLLRTDLAPDATFQARFRAEARTAAMLSHGGIAAVFDYGEANGSAYLVMELVPGVPLSQMITDEGALGTERTLSIVSQAARALHAAHRHGVIHRDIKPANLMVTPEMRVKVTDFGIARPRDHEPLTATGQVMGTAHYLAPELARGEVATPLSDVYALGVVAYECLAGWRPFEGDNQVAVATAHLQDEPPPLPETVPPAVRAIVVAAMSKNPAERPQGANALAALMEDLRLRGLARGAGQVGGAPRPESAWPSDAATPPRGTRAAARQARNAEQSGTAAADPWTPASSPSMPPGSYRPDSAPPTAAGPAVAPVAPGGAAPAAWAPGGARREERSGDGVPPAFADLTRPPANYDGPGSDRGTPGRPATIRPGGGSPSSRAGHSRTRGSGSNRNSGPNRVQSANRGPNTAMMPAGRPQRRGISVPLAALLVLILVVVLGSLWASRRNDASGQDSIRARIPTSAVALATVAADRE